MESFYPTIHHFGKASNLGNVLHGNFVITQQRSGAAGGDNFDAKF